MKPLMEKVLKSGLVEKHTAEMMERWGFLQPESSELVNQDALQGATKEQLHKLAEEIGNEVEKERTLRETQLDLDKIRWPTEVSIYPGNGIPTTIKGIQAVIDRMGRLYFRIQDVKKEWFIPGQCISRKVSGKDVDERIIEVDVLYVGDQQVCVQVSTTPV